MADIPASNPVVVPATPGITYDKWFITQLIGKISPEAAPLIVHLTRANKDDEGKWTLMPRQQGSELTFTVDAWKELTNTPEIATAIAAVQDAVVAFAHKKNLL